MIKVLQDWSEIGDANNLLSKEGLPKHLSSEKNWDLSQLYNIIKSLPRDANIIDLGCGQLWTLKLLHAMEFNKLSGIDLTISWKERLRQAIRMWRGQSFKLPFNLYKGDITNLQFPDEAFDLAVCVSVIEHGVDHEKFISELNRVLTPGGLLFITTDYWEDEIESYNKHNPYDLPWKIYSKKDIEDFVRLLKHHGFVPYLDEEIPGCSDRCIVWNEQEFTFLNLVFKKQ